MPAEFDCIPKSLSEYARCGGVGGDNASATALTLTRLHPVDALVSFGVAGALSPSLQVGDLLNPITVIDLASGIELPAEPISDQPAQRILTANRPILTAAEKQQCHQSYNAVAVDMESAAIARVAQAHKLPFFCVRVISDDARHILPEEILPLLVEDGSSRAWTLTRALLGNPGLVADLLLLGRNFRKALKVLRATAQQLPHMLTPEQPRKSPHG